MTIEPTGQDVMNKLKQQGEVAKCKCGKKFWIYWHNQPQGNVQIKTMSECAPCYFKHERQNI